MSSSPHVAHLQKNISSIYKLSSIVSPNMALLSTQTWCQCLFGVTELDFLGHHVSSQGITPLPDKVKAAQDFPLPNSQRKLQQFIGLANFYHRFLPHCAELMLPLHALLHSDKPKSQTITWNDTALAAFYTPKDALATATLLYYPQPGSPTCLVMDVGVGAVLQQHVKGKGNPISFFSKKLTPTQARYSTFDKELLAVYLAIHHFRHFLKGRHFHVFMDHKPLTHALHTCLDHHSSRQACHLDFISQFTSSIRHIKGLDNVVADALSRIESNALLSGQPPVLDFTAMAKDQKSDRQLHALESSPISPLVVKPEPLANSTDTILCDISTGTPRPLVPLQWRRTVFDSLHGLSHPGIRATQRLITKRFVWPGINQDVRRWTCSCLQCQ